MLAGDAAVAKQLTDAPRPCGDGRFHGIWLQGPLRGMPYSGYCAEPLCIQAGSCTGPRFVPHLPQRDMDGNVRDIGLLEAVQISMVCAQEAAKTTRRPDERSEAEIVAHVREVRRRTLESIQQGRAGDWAKVDDRGV